MPTIKKAELLRMQQEVTFPSLIINVFFSIHVMHYSTKDEIYGRD